MAALMIEPLLVTESSPDAAVVVFSKRAAMPLSSMVSEKSMSESESPPSVEMPVALASASVSPSTLAFPLPLSSEFVPTLAATAAAVDVATALTTPSLETTSLPLPVSIPVALLLAMALMSVLAEPSIVTAPATTPLVDVAIAATSPVELTMSSPLAAVFS